MMTCKGVIDKMDGAPLRTWKSDTDAATWIRDRNGQYGSGANTSSLARIVRSRTWLEETEIWSRHWNRLNAPLI
jgi:hypothetical protein